jgi:hypothetical protein
MVTPLHVPRLVKVLTNDSDEPAAVTRNGKHCQIAAILNSWRIDDEWWREEISRHYFQVELQNGPVMTIFHDLITSKWYEQRC